MKKSRLVTIFVLIAILVSTFVVSSALAKTETIVNNTVKNLTGGKVQMSLTLPNGKTFYAFTPGVGGFSIEAGTYSYYVATPCGALSGQINLTRAKTLVFSCHDGIPHLDVFVPNPPPPPAPTINPCRVVKFGAITNPGCVR